MSRLLFAALAIAGVLLAASPAAAQGCGNSNPNCIVPTQPPGTSNNTAASTGFVGQGIQTQGVNITVNPFTPPTGFPTPQFGIGVNQTATGTCSTANGANCHYNYINITSDNAIAGPNLQNNWGTGEGFLVNHNFGGTAAIGQRSAGIFNLVQTTTTGNTAAGVSYGALAAYGNATANDNGTDTTQANSRGQMETVNFIAHLGPSATNWHVVQGGEVDMNLEVGSSVYEKTGWQIVELATDAVQGSVLDAALAITNAPGAVGWLNGLQFGGAQGVMPIASTGTAISCPSPCGTMATGIDFSHATFSTAFLAGPSFSVDGSGTITSGLNGTAGGQLKLRGSTSGGATLTTGTTGALNLNNGTGNQSITFTDGSNGSMFVTSGASGAIAGHVRVGAATTGNPPTVSTEGSDTNISLQFSPKGSGSVIGPNFTATAAAPTVSAGQIGYGGTTAALSNCDVTSSGTISATGCIVVDIAGTTRYIPYY